MRTGNRIIDRIQILIFKRINFHGLNKIGSAKGYIKQSQETVNFKLVLEFRFVWVRYIYIYI